MMTIKILATVKARRMPKSRYRLSNDHPSPWRKSSPVVREQSSQLEVALGLSKFPGAKDRYGAKYCPHCCPLGGLKIASSDWVH